MSETEKHPEPSKNDVNKKKVPIGWLKESFRAAIHFLIHIVMD